MKLTGWYKGTQKPVRKGWYERSYNSRRPDVEEPDMQYWTGARWLLAKGCSESMFQNMPWRGVKKTAPRRKPKSLSYTQCSLLRMTAGGEKKYRKVIFNGRVKEWVGIGWMDLREATPTDYYRYPEVK